MSYYYYPLCTKDFTFENIFATESISPYGFYSKRGFGIDYFYKIPKVHHENAIILFDQPPKFETGVDNPSIIKFILAIAKDSLEVAELSNIKDGVFAYKRTIYLNKENFTLLFFSETEKRTICLKSESSLPTKSVEKYLDNLILITENDCKEFDFSSIEQFKTDIQNISGTLSYDRIYNTFKGFIYGILAGRLGEKSKDEIAVKRSFQEIVNCFSELKNRKDAQSKGLGTRYAKTFGVAETPVKAFYEKLIDTIIIAERRFYEHFPPEIISEEDVAKYLLSIKEQRLPTIEEAKRYVSYKILDDELLGTNGYQQIKNRYLIETGKKDATFYFDKLKSLAERSIKETTTINWNSDRRANINLTDDFKETLRELEKIAEKRQEPVKEKKRINLSAILLQSDKREIIIGTELGELTEPEREEYQMIVKVIWRMPKYGKGETKRDQVLKIVEEAGNIKNKSDGTQTRLYRYLNNEINDYSIEKASSIVMKNFIAFAFNIDSLESLDNYVTVKEVDKKWISSSFWCLFNGFANTSGSFLQPIFSAENKDLQNEIDGYLKSVFQKEYPYVDKLEETSVLEPESPGYSIRQEAKEGAKEETQEETINKIEEFYNKNVRDKYSIPIEKFIIIFQIKNKEQILKELKDQHKVLKKDGKKLIELFTKYTSSGTLF
jgi:hypothetical protein